MRTYRIETPYAQMEFGLSRGWWRTYRISTRYNQCVCLTAASCLEHLIWDLSSGVTADAFARLVISEMDMTRSTSDISPSDWSVRGLAHGATTALLRVSYREVVEVDLVAREVRPSLVAGESYTQWGLASVVAELYTSDALADIGQDEEGFRMPDIQAKQILEHALMRHLRLLSADRRGSPDGDLLGAVHATLGSDWALRDATASVAADLVLATQEASDAVD